MPPVVARLAFAAIALALGGCSGHLGRALHAYDEARYPDAIAELRAIDASELNVRQSARYALYRGLTHLALGDARAADRWLTQAKVMLDREPDVYDASERGSLLAAWRSMGRMPGETPGHRPAAHGSDVAAHQTGSRRAPSGPWRCSGCKRPTSRWSRTFRALGGPPGGSRG